jgi:hypothetical protein
MTTEIEVGDLARASGDTFKFDTLGDKLVGVITQVLPPTDRINRFNDQPETVYAIGITPDGETEQKLIWPVRTQNGSSPMLQAIVEAVISSGAKSYAVGGRLAVAHHEVKDTGKPQKLKLYRAKYEPPAASVAVPVDDDDLF